MEPLSQQLERLGKALKERELKDATSQVQRDGSTASDGKTMPEPETILPKEMLITSLPATLGTAASQVVQGVANGTLRPTVSPQNMMQKHSASDRKRLALALGKICQLQRQYGKTEAELEVLVEGFCWILPDYTMEAILGAIQQFVRKRADIPTPADIEAILNPPLPKPDWAAYVALKKSIHEGAYLLSDERKFLRECEEYARKHHAEEMENYRSAQLQIETHLRTFSS